MFSDPTGFSETIDLTQQTFRLWNMEGKKKEKELNISEWHISNKAVIWLLVSGISYAQEEAVGRIFFFFFCQCQLISTTFFIYHPPQWGHNRTDPITAGLLFVSDSLTASNWLTVRLKLGFSPLKTSICLKKWILVVHWTSRDTSGRSGVGVVL